MIVRVLLLLPQGPVITLREFRELRRDSCGRVCGICGRVRSSLDSSFYFQPIANFNSQSKKVYKIVNLTDEEATLVEPASCAIHGLDKLNAPVGVEALIIGAGPTGMLKSYQQGKISP